MHITRHLEGCTSQGTAKNAQKQHLEGCTSQGTPKDAHHKAPRRVHKTQHHEGCVQRDISKDARTKASRRMHTEREPEGCATRSPGKNNPESIYTSRINAKPTFERKKKSYNESRPDQHKYSATLHPGRARLKVSQLIETLALFTSCSMGIFTDKF